MPVPMLKGLAKQSGKSLSDVEAEWAKTKKEVEQQGKYQDDSLYRVIVSILKKRIGLGEK